MKALICGAAGQDDSHLADANGVICKVYGTAVANSAIGAQMIIR